MAKLDCWNRLDMGGLVDETRGRRILRQPPAGFNDAVFFLQCPAPLHCFCNAPPALWRQIPLFWNSGFRGFRSLLEHRPSLFQLADLAIDLGQNLVNSHGSSCESSQVV